VRTYIYACVYINLYVHSIIIVHRQDIIYRTSWVPRQRQRQRRSDFPGTIYIHIYDTHITHIHTHTPHTFNTIVYINMI